MHEERLAKIEARANAASAGPWETCRDNGANLVAMRITDARIVSGPEGDVLYVPSFPWNEDRGNAEAAFVAHARVDIPDLIAEIRRQRADAIRVAVRDSMAKASSDDIGVGQSSGPAETVTLTLTRTEAQAISLAMIKECDRLRAKERRSPEEIAFLELALTAGEKMARATAHLRDPRKPSA